MTTSQLDVLCRIKADHPPSSDWWFFPQEEETKVQGFLGTGKIFIVSDQPSLDNWPFAHPHRRAFYQVLQEENACDCHLTDFYKRRGCRSELKNGFDEVKHFDSSNHIEIFRQEVELLRPYAILAMGRIAEYLLNTYTKYSHQYIVHFGVIGHAKNDHDKIAQRRRFERSLRMAIRQVRDSS